MGLDIGTIVKDSYSTLFRNKTVLVYVIMIGILSAILSFSITSLIPVSSTYGVTGSSPSLANAPLVIGLAIVILLVSFFLTGAAMTAVQRSFKGGISEAAGNAVSRYISLLGTEILTGIIVGVPFIVLYVAGLLMLVAGLSAGTSGLALGVVLLIASIVVVALLGIRFSVSAVGAVIGSKRAVEAVKHSWSATKGNFWSLFGIFFIIGLVTALIGGGLDLAFRAAGLMAVGQFAISFMAGAGTIAVVRIYEALPG